MKPIPISLSPTRSRALNVFLGAVLTLSSILLLLALATYHPSDPSMNTATGPEPGNAVHNWIGLLGSYAIPGGASTIFAPTSTPWAPESRFLVRGSFQGPTNLDWIPET